MNSPRSIAHKYVLLDTSHRFDAGITDRDGPEHYSDGGLKIAFDGTGTIPSTTINGPDGEIELCGLAEIRAAADALQGALKLAIAFGPPIPLHEWRRQNT